MNNLNIADPFFGTIFNLLTALQAFQGDLGLDESLMSDNFYHTLREARIAEVRNV